MTEPEIPNAPDAYESTLQIRIAAAWRGNARPFQADVALMLGARISRPLPQYRVHSPKDNAAASRRL